MKALGLSVLLTLGGLAAMLLGLYGVGNAQAFALAGMVLLATAVMLAVIQVALASAHVQRRGRID
jgi:hypothetical protein